jgi:superfamily II DNA or RNA helicase
MLDLILSGGLALMQDRLLRLECADAFDWIYRLHRQGAIAVPHEAKDEFLIQLATMPDLPELEIPPELHWSKAKVTPRPRVVFAPSQADTKAVIGTVEFDYAGQVVGAGSARTSVADEDGKRIVRRDLRAERKLIERLKSLGLEAAGAADVKIASRDLGSVIRTLVEEGWYIEAEGAPIRAATGALKPKVSSGIDWFDLEGELEFGDLSVGLPELLEAAASGSGFVRLPDGSRGILPDWLDRYTSLAHAAKREGQRLRFLPSQAGIIDALLTGHGEANVDVKFERIRQALADGGKRALPDEPQGFFGKLRPYQKEGVAWLKFLEASGYGGCLADDMGLGKTVQVLAFLWGDRKKAPTLIVVPRSLVHNWIAESAKFTPGFKVVDYTGADRKKVRLTDYDLVVTTYGTLRQDVLDLCEIKFSRVILDEAQAIKNPTSQAAKACRLIRAEHRLAITGTPVENNLDELWSIFEFLSPGMLGRFEDFSANGKAADDGWLDMLATSLKPFMLRRTKDQVLQDLPKKTEQTIVVELKESERAEYDELRDWYRGVLTKKIDEVGFKRAKIQVLEALLRLRQAACHPGLIDADRMDDPSAKIDALMDMLEEVTRAGHKALVFSQFTTLLEIVRRRVEKANIRYSYLDGATRDRRGVCEQFQTDPGLKVFLISLKAGGCGLNLTSSDYVFILDPWWNPAVESQAIDRAHRMGQKKPVFAYRLIASETVEEKIVGLQDQKRKLADAIVTADGKGLRDLTANDLELLFGA